MSLEVQIQSLTNDLIAQAKAINDLKQRVADEVTAMQAKIDSLVAQIGNTDDNPALAKAIDIVEASVTAINAIAAPPVESTASPVTPVEAAPAIVPATEAPAVEAAPVVADSTPSVTINVPGDVTPVAGK